MPNNLQIALPEAEEKRLLHRIEEDLDAAKADHEHRCARFKRYYERFRNRLPEGERGSTKNENYTVPLIQIHTFAKWARQLESLFGDDAEVRASPVGPSDHKVVEKVSRYGTARFIRNKKIKHNWTVMLLWEIIWGRVHAYCPWQVDQFLYDGKLKTRYEGPMLHPLWPDDFIAPAESVQSVHDFSWVARRYRISPDKLLRGEDNGTYRGIRDNFEQILRATRDGEEREPGMDDIKAAVDEAEGVNYEGSSSRGNLAVVDWFGYWRPLKGRNTDAPEDDLKARAMEQEELAVSYVPSLHKIVGVKRLAEMYPKKPEKRPFVSLQLIKDGSYWSPGFGELLESIEDESTVNHRVFMKAGAITVGPFGFYKPSSGFDETLQMEPNTLYPSEDPQSVNWVKMAFNPEYFLIQKDTLGADAERITGQTDQTLGRSSDRPNAPRTATGQLALIEEGNTRAFIDVDSLRDDASCVLTHMWELEQEFSDKARFFRVTEEEAGGLFETRGGGATMEPGEFGSTFDFHVKFATSQLSKGADKERAITMYQLMSANPLFLTNPRALWVLTNKAWKAMGWDNLGDVLPEPPDLGLPKDPNEEWTMMLQGEDVEPNAQENEAVHLPKHYEQLRTEKEGKYPDQNAIQRLTEHIARTQQQKRQKEATTAILGALVQQMKGNGANGGLSVGGATTLPLQNLQEVVTGLTGAGPAQTGGAPGGNAGGGQPGAFGGA